ncbi:hypothetical protein DM02DRAFT_730287 [Periconia macrospinosa]|uniref:Uncharacterized protein n=1 Tax=Periconia macrospinosa TaxID=97972 RepID=A0A2V1DI77_9PLEO|nr:hypothetical protein DM02DRAFT_730287 [Periconia macrospinosa]
MARRHGTSDSKRHRSTRLDESPSRLEIEASPGHTFCSITSRRVVNTTAINQTPTTPVQASSRYEEGGVPLEVPHTPLRGTAQILSALSSTPTNEANTGRRRVNHSSILSHSPARPGHCSRMKQIFEQAGKSSTPSVDCGRIRYPQLPDISDHSSSTNGEQKQPFVLPGTINASPNLRAFSPPSAIKPNSTTSTPLYGNFSESWSDDSGYINAESFTHKSAETSRCWVQDWLSAVSEWDDDTDSKSHRSSRSCSPKNDDVGKHGYFSGPLDTPPVHNISLPFRHRGYAPADPFVSLTGANNANLVGSADGKFRPTYRVPPTTNKERHISDTCKQLNLSPETGTTNSSSPKSAQKPDMGLSLLSPNVCIERGTSQQSFKTVSGQKASKNAAYVIRQSSKENLAAEAETLYSSKMWQNLSPTVYTRTRSARYPQHTATEPDGRSLNDREKSII